MTIANGARLGSYEILASLGAGGRGEVYAVTAGRQRFLINAVVETEPNAPLTVVVNWAAGLKK